MEASERIESHRDLIVWRRAMDLAVAAYQAASDFPPEETLGLSCQLRHAAVSVAGNIAEGYGRASTGEYIHFLGMARGSNLELQTHLEIAGRLGMGDRPRLERAAALSDEVGRMLVSLIGKLGGSR
jgi:four helix bundle protein